MKPESGIKKFQTQKVQVKYLNNKFLMPAILLTLLALFLTACDSSIPGPPYGLTQTGNQAGEVSLNWGDSGKGVDGFVIERSLDNFTTIDASLTAPPDARDYTDKSVQPATKYYYRVISENGTLRSKPSNVRIVTTQAGK